MTFNKRIFISFVLLFITLILRETPYANIFIVNNIGTIYLFILFFVFLPAVIKFVYKWAVILLPVMLLAALFFNLIKLDKVAEIIGILIYFFLWIVIISKIYKFLKPSG